MRRSHHRATLTEAISEAVARFQADVRRLARTVLRGELGSLVATLEPMPPGAGTPAEHAEPVVGRRRSPVARPRKPATATRAVDAEPVVVGRRRSPVAGPRKPAAATATGAVDAEPVVVVGRRRSPVVGPRKQAAAAAAATTTPKPGTAARTSKPGAAARTSKPAAARVTRTSIAEPPIAELPIAELPIAEPPIAEPPIAEPVAAVAGTPEDPTVASVELEPEPAVAAAEPEDPEDPEPTSAGPHAESARPHAESVPVAEPGPAATNEELPWRERAQTRREESAERRQQRQERARIRREEAAGKRIGSAAAAGTRAAAPVPVHEEAPVPDGAPAAARRMQRGIVKWFSEAKGYGFIQGNDGVDVFVHRSEIVGDGFLTLHEGQTVEYVQAQSGKGLLAVDVVPVAQGTEAPRG